MVVMASNDDKEMQPSGLLASRETEFAKVLAGNEKKRRDQGLKKLRRWLTIRSVGPNTFTEDDFMKIWVGLYYSMWMSDKPLVQEELAESLSQLIFCFGENEDAAMLFIKCFHKTMGQSWAGLDQHRLDKFAMLSRRFLRQSLVFCQKRGWTFPVVKKLMDIFSEVVLHQNNALGLTLHFLEIFLEELAKVGREDLQPKVTAAILWPFIELLSTTKEGRLRVQLDSFLRHLIRQTDVALEYEEKFAAWRRAGFPSGHISQIVPDDDDETIVENEQNQAEGETNGDVLVDDAEEDKEESEENGENQEEDVETEEMEVEEVLDPRAGSVHVTLPQVRVPCLKIVRHMKKRMTAQDTTLKGRKILQTYIRHFRKLKQGKYPFAINRIAEPEKVISSKMLNKSAKKLIKQSTRRKKNQKFLKAKLKKLNAEMLEDKENESGQKRKLVIEDGEASTPKKKKRLEIEKREETVSVTPSKEVTSPSKIVTTPSKAKDRKRSSDTIGVKTSPVHESPVTLKDTATPEKRPRKRNSGSDGEDSKMFNVVLEVSPQQEVSFRSPPKATSTPPSPKSLANAKALNQKSPNKKTSPKKPQTRNWLVEDIDANTPIKPPRNVVCDRRMCISTDEGDPWAEPLQEGEYEVFLPKKKVTPTPVFWEKAKAKASPKGKPSTPTAKFLIDQISKPSSGRRISFNLDKNRAQETREYWEGIRLSPQIPYDAERKPVQSALKAGLAPSPINPFYRRKIFP